MPKTMFFNNVEYTANDFVDLFSGLTNNGIRATDDMKVSASSPNALSVDVAAGKMFVNGYYIQFETTTKVGIKANTSGYNRKDLICVKVNTNTQVTDIVAVEGTPSSSPVSPALPNVDGENYVCLATVTVGNNVNAITNANIEDNRLITKIWDDFNSIFYKQNNGYLKFPNGLVLQWGEVHGSLTNGFITSKITFPVTFSERVVFAGASLNDCGGYPIHGCAYGASCYPTRLTDLDLYISQFAGSTGNNSFRMTWHAIGY